MSAAPGILNDLDIKVRYHLTQYFCITCTKNWVTLFIDHALHDRQSQVLENRERLDRRVRWLEEDSLFPLHFRQYSHPPGLTANAVRLRVHKIETHAKLYLAGTAPELNGVVGGKSTAKSTPTDKRKATPNSDDNKMETPSKKRAARGVSATPKGRGKKVTGEIKEEKGESEGAEDVI